MANERPHWPFRPAPNGRRPPETGGQLRLLQRIMLSLPVQRTIHQLRVIYVSCISISHDMKDHFFKHNAHPFYLI